MSLNSTEQMVFDYLHAHPEEGSFWRDKVRQLARSAPDSHAAAVAIAEALGDYCNERAGVVPAFRDDLARSRQGRISMRNLADHLVRIWAPPRPKPAHPPVEAP